MTITFRDAWLAEIHATLRDCLTADNQRAVWCDLREQLYIVALSHLGTPRCKACHACIGVIDDALWAADCEEAIRPIEAEPETPKKAGLLF